MYSRELPGFGILTFAASGWTYKNTFVLYDFETESMWYHLQGTDGLTCISGEFADRKLPEFISTFTRWNKWLKDQPGSKLLNY